jgi:hypothetical protein
MCCRPQGLKSLCENCEIEKSAAKAGLPCRSYVVAKATTHKAHLWDGFWSVPHEMATTSWL